MSDAGPYRTPQTPREVRLCLQCTVNTVAVPGLDFYMSPLPQARFCLECIRKQDANERALKLDKLARRPLHLRDRFALVALEQILATKTPLIRPMTPEELAGSAYAIADAMYAESERLK